MKVDNLEVGKKYGNYKAMCKVLEVDEKEGSSRTGQIKDWSRYFDYKREGHGYIIEEVFTEPKPKIEKRGGNNNNIFGDITKLLIVNMLAEQDGKLSLSRTKLIEDIGIVNSNYRTCRRVTTKLSQYLGIDIKVIYDFYDINDSNFKSIIERALNSLMDERRIIYHTITKVKELGTYTYRDATKDELQTIVNVEGNMLIKMGYESISMIRKSKDWERFNKVTNDIIKTMTNIEYYFDAYNIVIHEERVLKGRDELLELILEKSKKEEYRRELNGLIIGAINKNANNRHEKSLSIENKSNKDKTRVKDNYVEDISKLSNVMNNIDHPSIVDAVNKEVIVKNKMSNNNINSRSIEIDKDMKQHIDEQLEGLFD